MKLLIDMNLAPRWAAWLTEAGIPAIHWATVGSPKASDLAIMAYAAAHDYVVLTQDLDFGAILAATGGARPSVVQIRADNLTPDAIGSRILRALRQLEPDLDQGALATIDPGRTRVTLLPLRPIV